MSGARVRGALEEDPMTQIDVVPARDALDEEVVVDLEEERRRRSAQVEADDRYEALLHRLSRQSVEKHFNPFVDIDWDDPDLAIVPTDPRWIPAASTTFGGQAWFEALDDDTKARMGLHRVASAMKIGLEFENVLKRGLLEYGLKLPNGSPEFRYVYHEVIEEAYHALMFQEFVNRSGTDVRGMSARDRFASRQVVTLARVFPPLFFLFVLGGEDPIDHAQRQILREGEPHPLVERIMRIHVTEEARHLSFARHYLKHTVPKLGRVRRTVLSVAAPLLLGEMAREMLMPPRQLVRRFSIPEEAVQGLVRSSEARESVVESLAKVRRLCVELGLVNAMTKPLWRFAGIWAD